MITTDTYGLKTPQPMWLEIATWLEDYSPKDKCRPRLLTTSEQYRLFAKSGPERIGFYPCPSRLPGYRRLSPSDAIGLEPVRSSEVCTKIYSLIMPVTACR